METKRFKPMIDRTYVIIYASVVVLLVALTMMCLSNVTALLITLAADIFTMYFVVSPFFGYVELGDRSVLIKYGFIIKREIPYGKIRELMLSRSLFSDSMLNLKNSREHVLIKYNTFDVTTVSVKGNDLLISEIISRKEKLFS